VVKASTVAAIAPGRQPEFMIKAGGRVLSLYKKKLQVLNITAV
jgi:hypothetical protein